MIYKSGWLWAGLVTLMVTGSASAQKDVSEQTSELFERTRDLFDENTFAVHVGAGFTDLVEGGTRTFTEPGGNWTVRGMWGMARMLGTELAYLGAAFPISSPAMDDDAVVVETGIEGVLRLGYPMLTSVHSFVTPFLAGGLGWSAFNLVGADEGNSASIRNADGVFSLPFGIGVTGGYKQFSADLRWMYRWTFGDDMFKEANQSDSSGGLNTAAFGATVGYRF